MAIKNFEEYEKQTWLDRPDTSTPISAERLNHMEQGIKDNSNALVWLDKNRSAVCYVTVTNTNGKYSADKTLTEIDEAYQSGKMIYCLAPNGGDPCMLPLVSRESKYMLTFEGVVFGKLIQVCILGSAITYTKKTLVTSEE